MFLVLVLYFDVIEKYVVLNFGGMTVQVLHLNGCLSKIIIYVKILYGVMKKIFFLYHHIG